MVTTLLPFSLADSVTRGLDSYSLIFHLYYQVLPKLLTCITSSTVQ